MIFFRHARVRKILTVFTGLVFINLSFFLAELNALEVRKMNRALWENAVKAYIGMSEEEKDCGAQSETGASLFKEFALDLDIHSLPLMNGIDLNSSYHDGDAGVLHPGVRNIHIPPPKHIA